MQFVTSLCVCCFLAGSPGVACLPACRPTGSRSTQQLAPAAQEVVDLRVKEKDAHNDACEAEEKLVALIERVHVDAMEPERLWKEQDDLLWAIEELHMGIDLAC